MSESNDQKHDQQEKEKAYSALHVGDSDFDHYYIWEKVWEPSVYDECVKAFVMSVECEEDEDEYENLRYASLNLYGLVKHLKRIYPTIDWRIKYDGYDDDYGGGSSWEVIAVPDEQSHEAESIIGQIEKSGDIMSFSGTKDFCPQLYDEHGGLRQEVTDFTKSFSNLSRFVYGEYLHQPTTTRQELEKQIIYLIGLLVDLYATGFRLYRIENKAEIREYPECQIDTDFQNKMFEIYEPYMKNLHYDNDDNPFELITFACESIEESKEMYDDGNPFDVASAVRNWQFGFPLTGSWATSVVEALKYLHEIYTEIKKSGWKFDTNRSRC